MKILLVGEYSRLHNSLKEGLIELGHEVTLISTGDYFKKFPSDLLLKQKFNTGFLKKIKVGIYKLTKTDITSLSILRQFYKYSDRLKSFDIVQLINEDSFSVSAKAGKKIIEFLKKNNSNLFLLSCGTDYSSVSFAMDKKIRYSILTPFLEGRISEKEFISALKYLKPEYVDLHHYLFENIQGVIASDMDYHIPLLRNPKYLGLIPNPINISKLPYIPMEFDGIIRIFHGINRVNYLKKGNDFFEKALKIIQQKYPEKVEVMTVENIPYDEYIRKYNTAHILLDQVYSFDQGYNALEAMAKGKVVFTGAEKEFLEFYNLKKDEVCINALPDVDDLVKKLEDLILNPEKIESISRAARAFIEREHDYKKIAQKYLDSWSDTKKEV